MGVPLIFNPMREYPDTRSRYQCEKTSSSVVQCRKQNRVHGTMSLKENSLKEKLEVFIPFGVENEQRGPKMWRIIHI